MIELRVLHDWEYFSRLALEDAEGRITQEFVNNVVVNYGLLFFEVYYKSKRQGVAFCLKVNGKYSLDGYSEIKGREAFFAAVEAGKCVCSMIKDEMWTAHRIDRVNVTALAKRIGFKPSGEISGKIVLRREYGN